MSAGECLSCWQGVGEHTQPSSHPSLPGSTRATRSPRATRCARFARGARTVWDEPHGPAGTAGAARQGRDPRAPRASGMCMRCPRGPIPGPPRSSGAVTASCGGGDLGAHQPHGLPLCWSQLLGILQGPQGPPGRDGAAGQPGPKGEQVSVPCPLGAHHGSPTGQPAPLAHPQEVPAPSIPRLRSTNLLLPGAGQLLHTLFSLLLLPRATWATLASPVHQDPRYCAWGGFLGGVSYVHCRLEAGWGLGGHLVPEWEGGCWDLGSSQSRTVLQLKGV